jgi:predicted ester cyclase
LNPEAAVSRDVVTRLIDARRAAWSARAAEGLGASYADNSTIVSPIFGTVQGRDQILKSYRDLFRVFPDWTFVGDPAVIDGDRVVEPFTVNATHSAELFGLSASGRRLEIQGVLLLELAEGLIRHERRLYDFTGMLVQLGVLKAKPAT